MLLDSSPGCVAPRPLVLTGSRGGALSAGTYLPKVLPHGEKAHCAGHVPGQCLKILKPEGKEPFLVLLSNKRLFPSSGLTSLSLSCLISSTGAIPSAFQTFLPDSGLPPPLTPS